MKRFVIVHWQPEGPNTVTACGEVGGVMHDSRRMVTCWKCVTSKRFQDAVFADVTIVDIYKSGGVILFDECDAEQVK